MPDQDRERPDVDGADGASDAEGASEDRAPEPTSAGPATWAGRQHGAEPRPEPGSDDREVVAEAEPPDPATDGGGGEDTVEADTLALADREAAREAALAGLKARVGDGHIQADAPPPDTESGPAGAPPVGRPSAPAAAEPEAPRRRSLWPRFIAGSLLIVIATATATAISLLVFLNGVLGQFHNVPGVQNELAVANPGAPQTILVLGSDKRPHGQEIAHSDTAMLVRIASGQITILSIPRDLKVNIPGYGINKFNAAYTFGGPKLTLKVIKQITGINEINHVVNVNFTGFADAVNSIGCVYVDVDHHYFNNNAGLALAEQYAAINIPAGYQRMCGYNALQYVRYRHDDNDLVREARQQEFLREMRQELPASKILDDYDQLIGVLKKYVTLDINKESDLITLAKLVLSASSAPVVQVSFPANLGPSYVTASQSAIKAAVAKFEGQTPTPVPGQTTTSASSGSGGGGGSSSGGGSGSQSGSGSSAPSPAAPPLIDATSAAQQEAAHLAATKTKSHKPMLDIPVYYPTKLTPGSTITSDSRAFPIDGPGNAVYHGYKIVTEVPTDGYEAYYGISGTDWTDPPILAHPDETRTLDGQQYLLSWDGPQLRLIGWKTSQGAYWIDNTLLNALTPGQMFGIAQSMRKYTG